MYMYMPIYIYDIWELKSEWGVSVSVPPRRPWPTCHMALHTATSHPAPGRASLSTSHPTSSRRRGTHTYHPIHNSNKRPSKHTTHRAHGHDDAEDGWLQDSQHPRREHLETTPDYIDIHCSTPATGGAHLVAAPLCRIRPGSSDPGPGPSRRPITPLPPAFIPLLRTRVILARFGR